MKTPHRPIQRPQYPSKPFSITQVEAGDLASLGWIQIVDVGEENVYFTDSEDRLCFLKSV